MESYSSPLIDEKTPFLKRPHNLSPASDTAQSSRRRRIVQHFLPAVLLTSALLLLLRSTLVCQGQNGSWAKPAGTAPPTVEQGTIISNKVALEAHIMSKCPDARDCLQQLVVPTMEQVSDKVDFRLSYIGRSEAFNLLYAPSC